MKFTHKILVAASAVMVLAFAGFSGSQYVLIKNQTESDLINDLGQLAGLTAHSIADWMNNKLQIVDAVAKSLDKDIWPQPSRSSLFKGGKALSPMFRFTRETCSGAIFLPSSVFLEWYPQQLKA